MPFDIYLQSPKRNNNDVVFMHQLMEQQQQTRHRYYQQVSKESVLSVLSMLNVREPEDIRDLMHNNQEPINIVELLQSLRADGYVAIVSGGWIKTEKGESYEL